MGAWTAPAEAQHPLLLLPLGDPAYAQLDALEKSGCVSARVSGYRPFTVREVRAALSAAAREPVCASKLFNALRSRFGADSLDSGGAERLDAGGAVDARATLLSNGEFKPLWRDVRPTDQGDPPTVVLARGRARWSAGPQFLAVGELYAESDVQNDPTVRAKYLHHTQGTVDAGESYLNGRIGPVLISFGRAEEAWLGGANGSESLILSANGPLLDRVMASADWGGVRGRAVIGALNDVTVTASQDSLPPGTPPARVERALAGAALSWNVAPQLELSVAGTMLAATARSPAEPYNFPYLAGQPDIGSIGYAQSSYMEFLGGLHGNIGKAVVALEMLLDNVGATGSSSSGSAGTLGYLARASVPIPTPVPSFISAQYRRVGSATYVRDLYSNMYQYYDQPLGSEIGPDADRLDGEIETWPKPVVQISAGASLWRRGASRIDARPSGSAAGGGADFLATSADRPLVQSATMANAGVRLLTPLFPVMALFEAARISNANNAAVAPALYLRMSFTGTYAINYP